MPTDDVICVNIFPKVVIHSNNRTVCQECFGKTVSSAIMILSARACSSKGIVMP